MADAADDDLGDVARAGLEAVPDYEGGAQGALEGTNFTKVTFVGVQYDTLDADPKLGDEMEFRVRGRIVAVGDEVMSDGHVRHGAKVKVSSVTLLDEQGNPVEVPSGE